ncbi:uracil-DNA glycosylase-like [Erethizon dorsatum]
MIFHKIFSSFFWSPARKQLPQYLEPVTLSPILQEGPGWPQQAQHASSSLSPEQLIHSLENIYIELSTGIGGFVPPGHGDSPGGPKGTSPLRLSLLSRPIKPVPIRREVGSNSPRDAVVGSGLNQKVNDLVFLLPGSYVQKRASAIHRKWHCVLHPVHLSPLPVHRAVVENL